MNRNVEFHGSQDVWRHGWTFVFALGFAIGIAAPSWAQLIVDGGPNVDDSRLYAWYDAADYLGFDGLAETPVWPNSQGEIDRSIWSAFGPSDDSALNEVTTENGLPAIEFIDVVSWSDQDRFGTIEDGFTVFVTANVRDPAFAYFFTGNQGGGGAEANANFQVDDFDVWSMKGDEGRILTGEVDSDVLQVHAFTFGEDGNAQHHINGALAGEGEIGFASLQGFVLGGRQNGGQRATIDFAEVLVYDVELDASDRETVESYLTTKHFESAGIPGDFDGDGELTAADLDLLSAAVRDGSTDGRFDLNGGGIDNSDRLTWINELVSTYVGDSNLDGEFNSSDLVFVFTAGEYEDVVDGNSNWADGDWDGNGDFDSSDFVAAFGEGGYELGPRPAVAAVPEPAAAALFLIGCLFLIGRRRPRA